MPGDFSNVLSKLRWAEHQIALLHIAVSDYIGLEPYVIRIKDEPEAQRHVATVHLRYPPPGTLAHIVGDALNSLQGVVDYLASELVIREGETPDLTTSFPIVRKANEDGSEPWVNITRTGDKGRGHVSVIKDATVLSLLRDVQPYKAGDDWATHPLQLLRTFNGISKHRHPAIVALTAGLAQHTFWYADGTVHSFGTAFGQRYEDGDEITDFPYPGTKPWATPGPPDHGAISACVVLEGARSFEGLEPLTVVDTLTEILLFIDKKILLPLANLF